jgi:hypothetical protein
MTLFRSLGAASAALVLTATVVAQVSPKPALDLRMGLWEVTSVTSMSAPTAAVDPSTMTPQQKAQMAAIAAAMGSRTNVVKSCMSADKFVIPNSANRLPGTTCEQTIQTNTRTLLENTMTCTGQRPSTSVSRTEADSPTGFKTVVTSRTTGGPQPMTVTINLSGKWLGASCGDVK